MKKIFSFLVALVTCTTMWAEPITVRLKASSLPSDWGDVAIYGWTDKEFISWPGEKLTVKDGWYSKTFAETVTSVNIIWNNNNKGKQTVDIKNVTSSTCYELNGGSGNSFTVKAVDCPTAAPEVSLTITGSTFVDSTLTFSALTTGFSGTPAIVYSVKEGEGEYTPLTGNSYQITAAGDYTVKAEATYNAEVASEEKSFTAIVTPEPITVRLKAATLPSGWGDVAIYYWGAETIGWPGETLTAEDGWYSKTFKSSTTSISIIWNNTNKGKQTGNIENVTASTCYEISGGSGTAYTVKTVDCKDTVPPTPEVKKYYITGDSALVGAKAWKADAIEMADSSYTFESMAAGSYKLKVTDGTWTNNWGFAALTEASSKGITGDADGNICFTVETPNNVVVSIANGAVTVTGSFKTDTVPEPPVETKYYAKNNWEGTEWTWKAMTKGEGSIYTLASVVFGGTGLNINDKEDGANAQWFALADIAGDSIAAKDTVTFVYNASDSTLTATLIGRPGSPTPEVKKYYITGDSALVGAKAWQADAIEMKDSSHTFMGMAAGSYKLKVTDGTWTNNWGYAALTEASSKGLTGDADGNICFTVEVPNNVMVSIANGAVTVTGTFKTDTVPEPPVETNYYAKNNWDNADPNNWTWKAMTKGEGSIYTLASVVFGGAGLNINDKEDGANAQWFALADIAGDSIAAKDTVTFVYNASDSTLTATLIGRPVPGPEPTTGVTVNVQVPAGTPACFFYGALSGNAFVEMTPNGENLYTITFSDKTAADLGWGYKFCWESGNWNTQAAPETTYTATDGTLNIVSGWQTNPTTTYAYTTYTEWNIKYAPNWQWEPLTQVGETNVWTATITWGGQGMNVSSCEECPIKKDWFPASDITGGSIASGTEVKVTMTVVDDETVTLKIEQTPATSLDALMMDSQTDGKFILKEQMVIRRNGVLYNANGMRIR